MSATQQLYDELKLDRGGEVAFSKVVLDTIEVTDNLAELTRQGIVLDDASNHKVAKWGKKGTRETIAAVIVNGQPAKLVLASKWPIHIEKAMPVITAYETAELDAHNNPKIASAIIGFVVLGLFISGVLLNWGAHPFVAFSLGFTGSFFAIRLIVRDTIARKTGFLNDISPKLKVMRDAYDLEKAKQAKLKALRDRPFSPEKRGADEFGQGGTADWLNSEKLPPFAFPPDTDNGMIWLGTPCLEDGVEAHGASYVGWADDRHVCLIAGSGSGKGRSLILNNLLTYGGSVIAMDPKGELAAVTAARRGRGSDRVTASMGQDVFVLDPFGIIPESAAAYSYRARYNPLAELNADDPTVVAESASIAQAMILTDDKGERHWTDNANSFLQGLIIYVVATEPPERRNLVRVRELLTQGRDAFNDLLFEMTEIEGGFGVAGKAAHHVASMSDNERSGVISTARTHTAFLDDPFIQASVKTSDFRMEDLKRKKTTIYLCLRESEMVEYNRWLRLLINRGVDIMQRVRHKPDVPVMFMLDEFATLGHLEKISKSAGLMRGMGMKLFIVVQETNQLKQHYKDNWKTFLQNAGITIAFGLNDKDSSGYISERIGKRRVEFTTSTTSSSSSSGTQSGYSSGNTTPGFLSPGGGFSSNSGSSSGYSSTSSHSSGSSTNERVAPLIEPDELEIYTGRQNGRAVAILSGYGTVRFQRVNYDKLPKHFYEEHPDFPGS